jgi:hypothetical protein
MIVPILLTLITVTAAMTAVGAIWGGSHGAMAGGVVGIVGGILLATSLANGEAEGHQYRDVAKTTDCRLKPIIDGMLADKSLTRYEYAKFRDAEHDLRFADDKDAALGRHVVKCTSREEEAGL